MHIVFMDQFSADYLIRNVCTCYRTVLNNAPQLQINSSVLLNRCFILTRKMLFFQIRADKLDSNSTASRHCLTNTVIDFTKVLLSFLFC